MSDTDRRLTLGLGQPVRLAANPSRRPGYVVAVMLTAPYEAWCDGQMPRRRSRRSTISSRSRPDRTP